MLDIFSYLLGLLKGLKKGKGIGKSEVIITGEITCTDNGHGNITITQDE